MKPNILTINIIKTTTIFIFRFFVITINKKEVI